MRTGTHRWLGRFSRDERGSAYFIVGTFLIMLLFVGMAVDFGIVFRYRRAMQNACDAAVLAGAQDLKNPNRSATTTAQTYATKNMTQDRIVSDNFQAQIQNVNGQPKKLYAYIHATVPLFFLSQVAPSIPVSVQCAAQIVPVTTSGLEPFGMSYSQFANIWTQMNGCTPQNPTNCFAGCPLIGTPTTSPQWTALTPAQQTFCSTDYNFNVNTSNSMWGPGNTGILALVNNVCGSNTSGASYFSCVMYNGSGSNASTPPPPYCVNSYTGVGAAAVGNTPYPACSLVSVSTGAKNGSGGNANPPTTYGTGLNGGIASVCSTPDPLVNRSASKWVMVLPLLDPALWGTGGANGSQSQIDIISFSAFEIDCPMMGQQTGSGGGILGRFVAVLDTQAVAGNPGGVDTGVETIILVQ